MKNKIFAILAVLSLTLCCLAGCGNSKENMRTLPGEILNSEDNFTVITEQVLEIPRIDEDIYILQGGCVTEEYAWFILTGRNDFGGELYREAYVIKYDVQTMEEVSRSGKLLLGHGNDATYVPETNEIYVSHAYMQRVSILDADTLTVKDVKKLKMANYAIEYNSSRESFVTANVTLGMAMYDKELKRYNATLPQDTTLVTQGICADDKYVYHVLYSQKSNTAEPDNMIFVLDWEGNLITKIPIGLEGCEPENISLVGDTFYIGCYNTGIGGGRLFTAKLVKMQSE